MHVLGFLEVLVLFVYAKGQIFSSHQSFHFIDLQTRQGATNVSNFNFEQQLTNIFKSQNVERFDVIYSSFISILTPALDNNSYKTWNSIRSSKTRSSNTRSEKAGSGNTRSNIDTRRASTIGVDKSEGQCPEVLYLYC